MIHNQDDYIQQQLNSAQIVNTIRHSRYFLISILLVCLYIFCIYQLHYHPADNYLNLWFILTEMVVCMCWLISTVYFKPNEFKLETAHRWLLAVVFWLAFKKVKNYQDLPAKKAKTTAVETEV
jgi:cell division protein FtsW (lipid II flippase)